MIPNFFQLHGQKSRYSFKKTNSFLLVLMLLLPFFSKILCSASLLISLSVVSHKTIFFHLS